MMKGYSFIPKRLFWVLGFLGGLGTVGAAGNQLRSQVPQRPVTAPQPTAPPLAPPPAPPASPPQTLFERLEPILIQAKDLSEAAQDYEKVATLPPGNERLSKAELHEKAILKAQNVLAQCVAANDDDCFNRTHFYLGRFYAAKGDWLGALNANDRYLSQTVPPSQQNRGATWFFARAEIDRLSPLARKQGLTRLLIESKQDYSRFQLDGTVMRIRPGTTLNLWVEAGKHLLAWEAPSPGKRTLQVLAESASMHVVLGEPEPPPPVALVAPVVPPTLPGKRVPRWGLVGVGIPLMAIGGFFIVGGGVGYSVNGQCVGDPCTARYDGTVAAPAYLGTGIGSFLLGTILTAVGGYGRVPSAQPPAPPVESASRTFGLSQ